MKEEDSTRKLIIALDFAINISEAEKGLIIFCHGKEDQYCVLSRNNKMQNQANSEHDEERNIFRFLLSREERFPDYYNTREKFLEYQEELQKKHRTIPFLVFPLYKKNKLFGILHLSHKKRFRIFREDVISTLQNFTDFLSLQILTLIDANQSAPQEEFKEKSVSINGDFDSIIGSHPKLLDVLKVVTQVAETNVPVLIEGETGTGKELIARAIHKNSQRRHQKMVSLNCGAFPENLLESEFFGYKRGAFTGAVRDHKGKFEVADGSTIFLDEVDEMSPMLQVKLLRILQWGEFSPLGSDEVRAVDVRIVAASKSDLKRLVDEGSFRDDLYYRLNLIKLELPPLRERKEDILQLAYHFLNRKTLNESNGYKRISPEAQTAIQSYNYPGNVRELENIIKRAAILCKDDTIKLSDLPEELRTYKAVFPSPSQEIDFQDSFKEAKRKIVENFEKTYLQNMLEKSAGVIAQAAKRAGMHEKNFRQKLKYYQIRP